MSSAALTSSSWVLSIASLVLGFAQAPSAFASCSSATVSSWSFPTVVSSSSFSGVSLPSLSSSVLPPCLSAALSVFLQTFAPSVVNPVVTSSLPSFSSAFSGVLGSSSALWAEADTVCFPDPSGLRVSVDDDPGTSGTAVPDDDFDPDFDKGDKDVPSGKFSSAKSFQDMISLITSYFPSSRLAVDTDSDPLIPWMDSFRNARCHPSRVYLSLFQKLSAIPKEVDAKFLKFADKKKKPSSSLPS